MIYIRAHREAASAIALYMKLGAARTRPTSISKSREEMKNYAIGHCAMDNATAQLLFCFRESLFAVTNL